MQAMLSECLRLLDEPDARAPDVSGWSVHQQLEHIAVSAEHFLVALDELKGGGGSPGGRPKFIARVLLTTGFIPRGKAQAPDFVLPTGRDDVRDLLETTRARYAAFGPWPKGGNRLPHPMLGAFSARQWARFAEVHTKHHKKIVRDIRKAARKHGV